MFQFSSCAWPGPRDPNGPSAQCPYTARAQGGHTPKGESPRVLGQGPRLGRDDGPYIGVHNTKTHVGGQLSVAATVARSAPSTFHVSCSTKMKNMKIGNWKIENMSRVALNLFVKTEHLKILEK